MRIHRDLGDSRAAVVAAAEAEKYRIFAQTYLAGFDRVTVCSETDAVRLAKHFPDVQFAVVPNGFQPAGHSVCIKPAVGSLARIGAAGWKACRTRGKAL